MEVLTPATLQKLKDLKLKDYQPKKLPKIKSKN